MNKGKQKYKFKPKKQESAISLANNNNWEIKQKITRVVQACNVIHKCE
jgi:hypothetical protein